MLSNRREFVKTAAGTLTATALSGCLGLGIFGSTSKKSTIKIDENGFTPKNTKVEKEAEVSWENTGEKVHVIANGSDNWDFETELPPGNITYQKFYEKGVFTVIDKKNKSAKMKVSVGGAEIENPVE